MKRCLTLLTAVGALALSACSGAVANNALSDGESASQAAVSTLSATELARLVAANKVVLIDVRTPEEFAEGRISGGLNAPVQTFVPASIPQEAGRETILYCRSSRRSQAAAEQLAAYLGKPVRHLEGGIIAWQEAGEAIVK